jgi:REP element-mobilizing transposase RayT
VALEKAMQPNLLPVTYTKQQRLRETHTSFVSAYPQLPAHKLAKRFKGRSRPTLRKELPELLKMPTLWTRSYFVSTAGNVGAKTIDHYIEAQKGA